MPLVLLGDQPLTTDAWTERQTSLLYIYRYNGAKVFDVVCVHMCVCMCIYVCMYVYMCMCVCVLLIGPSMNSSQISEYCIAKLGMGTRGSLGR